MVFQVNHVNSTTLQKKKKKKKNCNDIYKTIKVIFYIRVYLFHLN